MTLYVEKAPQRKAWTRDEAARLTEILPGQRYELIEGELINKMGQKSPHAFLIALLDTIFSQNSTRQRNLQIT